MRPMLPRKEPPLLANLEKSTARTPRMKRSTASVLQRARRASLLADAEVERLQALASQLPDRKPRHPAAFGRPQCLGDLRRCSPIRKSAPNSTNSLSGPDCRAFGRLVPSLPHGARLPAPQTAVFRGGLHGRPVTRDDFKEIPRWEFDSRRASLLTFPVKT